MSVNTKYFRKISIPKDGNCLFRSMVLFLNEHLIHCRRNRSGLPTNKEYCEYENSCTAFLRKSVVRMIKARKRRYSAPEFFDSDRYESIEERIENMTKNGEFGGKLEMDIISRMYKINIHVFIPFNGEFSCIYKTNSNNSVIDLQTVFDDQDSFYNDSDYENDYEYSEGRYCFLLLDGENYSILEPNYSEIKQDLSAKEEYESSEELESNDTIEENLKITITEKRRLSKYPSSSELSDQSLLNSSNNTTNMNFDDFEQITSEGILMSATAEKDNKINKHTHKFNTFLDEKKNGILVHSEMGPKLLEIKENYKCLNFNDLFDIIQSIEQPN